MSYKPNTVTRLQRELYSRGYRNDGFGLPLEVGEQQLIYGDVLSMKVGGVYLDFYNRRTEDMVEMHLHVTADRLRAVCDAIADTHGSARHLVGIEVITSVTTAVAVCEALRGA